MLKWHKEEKDWWNTFGDYMSYQWKLTPQLHRLLRNSLEKDYINYLSKKGGRLLDIGCGSGWLTFKFAEVGMRVHGIDVSEEQINAALRFKHERKANSVIFECADFLEWDCTVYDGEFDSIFVSAFLHHLPESEMKEAFEKIAYLLKPGGRVFLYEPLTVTSARSTAVKLIDALCSISLTILLNKMPNFLNLFSERHISELARGYRMTSPHERPVELYQIRKFCSSDLHISNIKGWHLHSLGFAMQITSLKQNIWKYYEPIGIFWYGLDKLLFFFFGWQSFSVPGRFILCGIKLTKTNGAPRC